MCEEPGTLLSAQLTFCRAGKQTQVCGGRLCLSWKVGQTVGTFLWPCFCKVEKENEGGETLNHQHFSIELPEAACARSFLYSPSCQNHYQSVFHESADKELILLYFFCTAFFSPQYFFVTWLNMMEDFLNSLFALNGLFDNCADVYDRWGGKVHIGCFMWNVTSGQNLIRLES